MDSMFTDILRKLIDEQGREVLLSNVKCKSFLADYTHNEYKIESRLLLFALEAEVSNAINTAKELEICKKQQVRILNEDYSIELDTAVELVDMLALVLRGEESTPARFVCSNCGKELQKDWKVCPYCSTPLKKTKQDTSLTNAVALFNKGKEYYYSNDKDNANKKFDEAINILNIVIELNPNDASVYALRGDAYCMKGQYDDSIKDLNEAIRLDPNSAYAYSRRGNAYRVKKQFDIALFNYNEAIRLDPNNAYAYSRRGDTYRLKGQYDIAINDFNEAIRLEPDKFWAYYHRGQVYNKIGQKDPAIKDLEKALSLRPDFSWVEKQLSEIRGY
jgi:tetratricopeptide (TPR) repeat protein